MDLAFEFGSQDLTTQGVEWPKRELVLADLLEAADKMRAFSEETLKARRKPFYLPPDDKWPDEHPMPRVIVPQETILVVPEWMQDTEVAKALLWKDWHKVVVTKHLPPGETSFYFMSARLTDPLGWMEKKTRPRL